MPDLSLDPSALTFAQPPPPSSLSSKSNGAYALAVAKATRTFNVAPRIDLEPLCANLKAAIPDYWAEYKQALGLFVQGLSNQNEFCNRTDHFLSGDPQVEHLHNQLVAGIFANVGRDLPEPGVAPWVSANDKPVVVSKPASGDAAEQRLKTEVMQLPARDRRRLKDVVEQPDGQDPIYSQATEYQQVMRSRGVDQIAPSTGGKTNWDLEIRKRYAQPLAAESGEFPDAEVIQARMVPICYGECLPNGCAPSCAGFMASAAEQYIKELLSAVYCRTRTNMTGGSVNSVQTHKFKSQLQVEEDMFSRKEVAKVTGTGLLPVEAREAAARPSLAMHDLKLSLEVGDIGIGQFPFISSRISSSYAEGEYEEYQRKKQEAAKMLDGQERLEAERLDHLEKINAQDRDTAMKGTDDANGVNGDNGINGVNGIHGLQGFDEEDEEDDWGWDGGSVASRSLLTASLDQCLSIEL